MAAGGTRVDGRVDTVLIGGPVHLGSATPGPADWLAVAGGRIVAFGAGGPDRDLIGAATRVIDVRGGMILPGFQDAHVHPLHGGVATLTCELHDLPGVDAYTATIATYAREHPDIQWITGSGWAMPDFPGGTPRRETLDAIVPDRPVFLINRDGHGAWANSKALDMAGVNATTPDPVDGRIERDPDGSPTGALHEGAMDLVGAIVPPPDARLFEDALTYAQTKLHALGITAWQDAWVEAGDQAAYAALDAARDLTARVVAALWWDRGRGLEQIPELVERRAALSGGHRVSGTSVKIMQDGVCENHTAAMLRPYTDAAGSTTGNAGLSMVEPGLLREAVTRLDAEGFQVHFHAIGDRAVREALDACEAALTANGPSDGRHHIAHIQFVHPSDVPRFRALRVTANAQPFWACHEPQMDDLTIPFVGEAAAWQYPFLDLRRAGAALAFGSDWPVSTPDPLLEIEVAVRRIAPGDDAESFLPDQRLDLPTALDAFTRGSAFVNHLDDRTGSVEVGKLADLAVLDRDLFGPDAGAVGDASVVLTMVGGDVVFAGPDYA